MEVLFLSKNIAKKLKTSTSKVTNLPSPIIDKLKQKNMLVKSEKADLTEYQAIKRKYFTKNLPIYHLYLFLTERCNFNCRYCFISQGKKGFGPQMTTATAKSSIDLFAKVIAKVPLPTRYGIYQPSINFYGGEPLLNWDTLLFILKYIDKLKNEKKLPPKIRYGINTNASLVTPKIAKTLAQYNFYVAVSLDGNQTTHNQARVYPSGKGTFKETMRGYKLLKKAGINPSIACTVSEQGTNNILDTASWLINHLGVNSFSLNTVEENDQFQIKNPSEYARKMSNGLINVYKKFRNREASEANIRALVNSFNNKNPRPINCGACGGQIIVTPTGKVTLCPVFLGNKDWTVENTPDFDPLTHPYWQEWGKRSPFNMPQCTDCVALGICGGGCPYEALYSKGSIWELDDISCVHAQKTVNFLVKDLFDKTMSSAKKSQKNKTFPKAKA